MSSREMQSSMVLILAAVATVVTVAAGSTLASEPELVMPEQEFDFGYVAQNVKVSHPFVIRNKGGDTLKIVDVNPG